MKACLQIKPMYCSRDYNFTSWSFFDKYIALCNWCLSALRASQIGSDLYFLKTHSLFLTTHFCWVISSLSQDLGGHWVTTFVLSGAMASSVDFKLPENLDISSSKSSMLRREWVSIAFPNNLVSMDLILWYCSSWCLSGALSMLNDISAAKWSDHSGPWIQLEMVILLLHLVKTRSRVLQSLWVGKSTHWNRPVATMASWNILAFTSILSLMWMLKVPKNYFIFVLYCDVGNALCKVCYKLHISDLVGSCIWRSVNRNSKNTLIPRLDLPNGKLKRW